MSDEIKSYLDINNIHRRGDSFLEDYKVIRLYGSEIDPYRLSKLLTTVRLGVVRQLLHEDETCFTKSKKNSNIVYPITLGGYVF
jgi:hypothetical protein